MSYERFVLFFKKRDYKISSEFNQNRHLPDFHSIKAKSLVSGRDTVVRSNLPDGGLCLGFSLLMIEQHFNFPDFLSTLGTAEGKGKVRGYMFMQDIRRLQPLVEVPDYSHGNAKYFNSWFKTIHNTVTMAMSKNFTQVGSQGGSYRVITGAAAFIKHRVNNYFQLTTYGDDNAHSFALAHTEDCYGFFDPNYGIAEFPKIHRKSALAFCHCLENYIEELYRGNFHSHFITAFRSKKQPIATMQIAQC